MTTRRTTSEPTAAEAYAARARDITRLLGVLGAQLDRHADRARADPRDWGYPGDLGKVRADLVGLVAFLGGIDPGEAERRFTA